MTSWSLKSNRPSGDPFPRPGPTNCPTLTVPVSGPLDVSGSSTIPMLCLLVHVVHSSCVIFFLNKRERQTDRNEIVKNGGLQWAVLLNTNKCNSRLRLWSIFDYFILFHFQNLLGGEVGKPLQKLQNFFYEFPKLFGVDAKKSILNFEIKIYDWPETVLLWIDGNFSSFGF